MAWSALPSLTLLARTLIGWVSARILPQSTPPNTHSTTAMAKIFATLLSILILTDHQGKKYISSASSFYFFDYWQDPWIPVRIVGPGTRDNGEFPPGRSQPSQTRNFNGSKLISWPAFNLESQNNNQLLLVSAQQMTSPYVTISLCATTYTTDETHLNRIWADWRAISGCLLWYQAFSVGYSACHVSVERWQATSEPGENIIQGFQGCLWINCGISYLTKTQLMSFWATRSIFSWACDIIPYLLAGDQCHSPHSPEKLHRDAPWNHLRIASNYYFLSRRRLAKFLLLNLFLLCLLSFSPRESCSTACMTCENLLSLLNFRIVDASSALAIT